MPARDGPATLAVARALQGDGGEIDQRMAVATLAALERLIQEATTPASECSGASLPWLEAGLRCERARLLGRISRLDESLVECQAAALLEPRSERIWSLQGAALCALRRWDEAEGCVLLARALRRADALGRAAEGAAGSVEVRSRSRQ